MTHLDKLELRALFVKKLGDLLHDCSELNIETLAADAKGAIDDARKSKAQDDAQDALEFGNEVTRS